VAAAGDVIVSRISGQEIRFVSVAPDLLVMESRLVGGVAPPPHLHPSQDERFTVLEGTLTASLGDQERILEAGDVLEVPAGTPHQMSGDARVRWETRPPLRTAEFFEALFALDAPEDALRVLGEFAAEIRLAL
jgi:mannose-6-phosphate isomerase-like protein (cupin superfamily)